MSGADDVTAVVVVVDRAIATVVGVGDDVHATQNRENSASALVLCRPPDASFTGGVYVSGAGLRQRGSKTTADTSQGIGCLSDASVDVQWKHHDLPY